MWHHISFAVKPSPPWPRLTNASLGMQRGKEKPPPIHAGRICRATQARAGRANAGGRHRISGVFAGMLSRLSRILFCLAGARDQPDDTSRSVAGKSSEASARVSAAWRHLSYCCIAAARFRGLALFKHHFLDCTCEPYMYAWCGRFYSCFNVNGHA